MVIEERPGAGTTIGTREVINAKSDGYTLLFNGPNLAFFQEVYPNLNLDPLTSLTPIGTVVSWSNVLVVRSDLPVKSMIELIAYAKANPGQLKFGYGLGTPPHILGATLMQTTGVNIIFVPYKGGEQARTDLLGGRVDINIAPVGSLLPFIQQGKMRPLAFTGRTRAPTMPDVPTMAECGFPQLVFDPDDWDGVVAPAGTPTEIVNKLNGAINESLKSQKVMATYEKLGFDAKAMSRNLSLPPF